MELLKNLFSIEFLVSILRLSTPLLFVAMAAIVGAKANIICFAFEGIMLFAAFFGVVGSAFSQSLLAGLAAGIFSGVVIAFIFGYFVLYLDTKPILIALALNIFGSGGTIFALYMITGAKGNSLNLPSLVFPELRIPVVENIPVLGQILSGHNVLTYVAIISVFFINWMIYKTRLGLNIRAVGENPDAAEAVGIDVRRTKLIAVLISGVLASMGGVFMSMGYISTFTRDMIAGRGFIGIAAESLGRGNPIATMLCTFLFGAAEAAGNISQSYRLPSQFAQMLPYAATLLGLTLMSSGKEKKRQSRGASLRRNKQAELK